MKALNEIKKEALVATSLSTGSSLPQIEREVYLSLLSLSEGLQTLPELRKEYFTSLGGTGGNLSEIIISGMTTLLDSNSVDYGEAKRDIEYSFWEAVLADPTIITGA